MEELIIRRAFLSHDCNIFLLIGLTIATVVGIKMKNIRKNTIGMVVCLVTYVVCEIAFNKIGMNYFIEVIVLLFVGTIAIGGFIGFLIGFVVSKVRN